MANLIKEISSPINYVADVTGVTDSVKGIWNDFTGQTNVNATNAAQVVAAKEQMAFQERMSSTAHQREVEDLKKAGLNPVLSSGGSGASAPSGAMANLTANPSGNKDAIMALASFALNAMKTNADVKNTVASTVKTMNDAEVSKRTADLISKQTQSTAATAKSIESSLEEKQLKSGMWKGLRKLLSNDVGGTGGENLYNKLLKKVSEKSETVPYKLKMNDLPINQ